MQRGTRPTPGGFKTNKLLFIEVVIEKSRRLRTGLKSRPRARHLAVARLQEVEITSSAE